MITGHLYSNHLILFFLFICCRNYNAWYVAFRCQKHRVYESWGVCSEYVVDFSSADFQSYSTRMQAEEAYQAFMEHIAEKGEHA
jgi:viroplasmin and RNaseH domain-containing protein